MLYKKCLIFVLIVRFLHQVDLVSQARNVLLTPKHRQRINYEILCAGQFYEELDISC